MDVPDSIAKPSASLVHRGWGQHRNLATIFFFLDSLVFSSLSLTSLTSFVSLLLCIPSEIQSLSSVQFLESFFHQWRVIPWRCGFASTIYKSRILAVHSLNICDLYWYRPTQTVWGSDYLRRRYTTHILLKDLAPRHINAKKPNRDAMEPTRTACEVLCPTWPAKASQD